MLWFEFLLIRQVPLSGPFSNCTHYFRCRLLKFSVMFSLVGSRIPLSGPFSNCTHYFRCRLLKFQYYVQVGW
jgi:hypothetical protein